MPESTMAIPIPVPSSVPVPDAAAFAASVPVVAVTCPTGLMASLVETWKTSGNEDNSATLLKGRVSEMICDLFNSLRVITPFCFRKAASSLPGELFSSKITETRSS
jgi:hypothetical protein